MICSTGTRFEMEKLEQEKHLKKLQNEIDSYQKELEAEKEHQEFGNIISHKMCPQAHSVFQFFMRF